MRQLLTVRVKLPNFDFLIPNLQIATGFSSMERGRFSSMGAGIIKFVDIYQQAKKNWTQVLGDVQVVLVVDGPDAEEQEERPNDLKSGW